MIKKVKKRSVELTSVSFYCPNLDKEVVIQSQMLGWSAQENQCEMCGSHGSIILSVQCSCKKKRHDIEIYSW